MTKTVVYCCGFAAVGPAGRKYRSTAARRAAANARSATFPADVESWTQTCNISDESKWACKFDEHTRTHTHEHTHTHTHTHTDVQYLGGVVLLEDVRIGSVQRQTARLAIVLQ